MKQIYIFLIVMFFFLDCTAIQEEKLNPESHAVTLVVDSLIRKRELLEYSSGLLKEFLVDLDVLNRKAVFYGSGSTCLLSGVNEMEDEYTIQDVLKIQMIRGLNEDRKHKEGTGIKYAEYELPVDVKKSKIKEFAKLGSNNSFFLIVKHHLEFEGTYLVEVSVTSLHELPNISQYMFYVYLNKQMEVVKWDFAEGFEPSTLEICEQN
ncbi:hypothetical protein MM213_19575 [Belliella sp. R4-6]|uniref:Lipoprotein n=1 Tax=Belliella alkalica TaxID=1730871 RepID=A0ABS9VI61_9BACT|nr:hypothetical protein [Belliella alkalica]MCH7415710.1 hypothetical protein [Belliella alkalica]